MSNITRRQDLGLGKTAAGGSSGSFASHERGAGSPPPEPQPEAVAEVAQMRADEFADIRQDYWSENEVSLAAGESVSYTPDEVGIDTRGQVTLVNVQRSDDGAEVTVSATVNEDPVSAGALTQEQFNRGYMLLSDSLEERYGADSVQNTDDNVVSFDMHTTHRNLSAISPGMAGDLVRERTKLVDWINESDKGTYGSPYFYAEVQQGIDRGFFPGASRDGDFTMQERESVKEAASFAVHGRRPDSYPQLSMLARRGYCTDAKAARDELRYANQDVGEIRETRQLMEQLNSEIRDQDERKQ